MDKVNYLILLGIAIIIGNGSIIIYGLIKYKEFNLPNLIKEKGNELSMFILISIPGSYLPSLLICGIICIILNSIFGINVNQNQRNALIYCIYTVTLVTALIFVYKHVFNKSEIKTNNKIKTKERNAKST